MKGNLIHFTEDQYKQLYQAATYILPGRRGNSSRKSRVRRKLFKEVVKTVVENWIKEQLNEKSV